MFKKISNNNNGNNNNNNNNASIIFSLNVKLSKERINEKILCKYNLDFLTN